MTAQHRGTAPHHGTARPQDLDPERGTGHGSGPGLPYRPGLAGGSVLPYRSGPSYGSGPAHGSGLKRGIDLLGGAALLLLLAPALGAVALSLRLADEGPVLRRRTMAGRGGRTFTMLTFRTRSPLAALPLLLHVVRGEMSLVGPCPLAPGHPECTGGARRRLSVRPGLTGPWQISGRSDLPWEERELLDLHYVDHHWLGMDLAVLARTLPAVRRRRLRRASARAARLA
ncbi:sugar transferase [Streptomyces filamentosus]|uniref:sugar transferase n=1 Tax=Streptomyces filamentosus TaxID=67294 RepID=UPI0033F51573